MLIMYSCFYLVSVGVWKGLCHFMECCTDKWTKHNHTNLDKAFNEELFGQHLVPEIVFKAVVDHIETKKPKKALVLSFHGWTGTGKNHVSDLVAKHVYREGTSSKYVHKKIAPTDYPNHGNINRYKEELKTFIMKETKHCERSLFIFDEFDKMPTGLADVLKPFLDFHDHIEQIDFRKNIFVFLSNTAGDIINKETVKHFRNGSRREELTSKHMNNILSHALFNMEGGLKSSDLIFAGLVDFFVPFLPLERHHVKQCVAAELIRRNEVPKEHILENVVDELQYFPKEDPLFSSNGCKMVAKKVSIYL